MVTTVRILNCVNAMVSPRFGITYDSPGSQKAIKLSLKPTCCMMQVDIVMGQISQYRPSDSTAVTVFAGLAAPCPPTTLAYRQRTGAPGPSITGQPMQRCSESFAPHTREEPEKLQAPSCNADRMKFSVEINPSRDRETSQEA